MLSTGCPFNIPFDQYVFVVGSMLNYHVTDTTACRCILV